jgi:hypothetical protein
MELVAEEFFSHVWLSARVIAASDHGVAGPEGSGTVDKVPQRRC